MTIAPDKFAMRRLRAGDDKNETISLVRRADKLWIIDLQGIPSPTIVELAQKAIAREVARARRRVFQSLLDNLERYRSTEYRASLLDEILESLLAEYTDWERCFGRDVLNVADSEFATSLAWKPIEVVGGQHDLKPNCSVCQVSKADRRALSFDSLEIAYLCSDCSRDQVRGLHASA